jgi:transcriptional regulator with XRE-family HTH domain
MTVVSLTPQGLRVLGERLKNYREARGWSQREASRHISERVKAGITPTALGRIEAGSVTVKLDTLLMLSQIGYGNMGFSEMVDLATENRLAACEGSSRYCAV